MTEEIKYNKDEKWIPYKQLEETPQQTIARLEQENKELGRKAFLAEQNVQTTAATFCEKDNKIIELEQENKELKSDVLKWQKAFSRQYQINENKGYSKAEENYRSALEEIKKTIKNYDLTVDNGASVDTLYTIRKIINEVLNDN